MSIKHRQENGVNHKSTCCANTFVRAYHELNTSSVLIENERSKRSIQRETSSMVGTLFENSTWNSNDMHY